MQEIDLRLIVFKFELLDVLLDVFISRCAIESDFFLYNLARQTLEICYVRVRRPTLFWPEKSESEDR